MPVQVQIMQLYKYKGNYDYVKFIPNRLYTEQKWGQANIVQFLSNARQP